MPALRRPIYRVLGRHPMPAMRSRSGGRSRARAGGRAVLPRETPRATLRIAACLTSARLRCSHRAQPCPAREVR